jgi:hypothetical protein
MTEAFSRLFLSLQILGLFATAALGSPWQLCEIGLF